MIGTKGCLSHYNLYVCVCVSRWLPGSLCCGTWDLQLWRVGSSPLIRDPSLICIGPLHWEHRVLATRPLGKSQPHYNLDQRKKWKKVKLLSRIRLFETPWTVAHQAPPSTEFSRQEYWNGLPFPFPRNLPNPGIEPGSPALQADTLPLESPGKTNLNQTSIQTHVRISLGLPRWH